MIRLLSLACFRRLLPLSTIVVAWSTNPAHAVAEGDGVGTLHAVTDEQIEALRKQAAEAG